ncbi:MAG: hypothetical protein ABIL09_19715 [Gemmatimonadota bacterium]
MYSTIWSYLWDLVDDGIEDAVRRLRQEVGLDAVSVATAYHTFQQLRPQRPGRKLLVADRAAVYFRPDLARYRDTAIRPHVAEMARRGNPLERLAGACQAQGLDLISWTVCLHNTYLSELYPAAAQQTAYGDPLGWHLCPGSDDARSYLVALCSDLVSNYGCRRIELESCNFGGYGHSHHHPKDGVELGAGGRYLLGLSFSEGCRRRAAERGLDADALAGWVRSRLDPIFAGGPPLDEAPAELAHAQPLLAAYQDLREELVASLVGEIGQACGGAEVSVILMGDRWNAGLRPEALVRAADRVEILAYTPSADQVEERVRATLRDLSSPSQLVVGLQAYPPAARQAAELRANVDRARSCGVEQFSFYNYGIMPRASLDWVRTCLQPASGRPG